MTTKIGFLYFTSAHEAIQPLKNADRLKMYDAVLNYGLYGTIPKDLPPHLQGIFILIKPSIDRTKSRYDAARANGSKGGRPPNNQTQNQNDNQNNNQSETPYKIEDKRENNVRRGGSGGSKAQKESDAFKIFWSVYPKKKSKADAEKAFHVLNPDSELLTKMLSALERAKTCQDWTKGGGQFIPYPASWLRGRRWEDDYEQQADSLFEGVKL